MYRVVVERSAFTLKASVVPDYLAVAVVAAIVAGARNNPSRVDLLRTRLEEAGWESEIQLSRKDSDSPPNDSTRVCWTTRSSSRPRYETLLLIVSEFVLDQMVVTKTGYGEVRPAVERSVADVGDVEPWLYDPSERDRSTRVHRALENWLIQVVRDRGLEAARSSGRAVLQTSRGGSAHRWSCARSRAPPGKSRTRDPDWVWARCSSTVRCWRRHRAVTCYRRC